MEQLVTVTRDGKPVRVPIANAIYDRLALNAAKGDFRSAKLIIDLLRTILAAKEESVASLVKTILETDQQYADAAAAYPDHAEEIRKEQAMYRRSGDVLEAFRRVDRPMPKRGRFTSAESLLENSTEPPWDLFEEQLRLAFED